MDRDIFLGQEQPAAAPQPATTNPPAAKPARQPKASASTSAEPQLRFEQAFSRLEQLVNEMERGELPLEQMLDRFEEGVQLVRHCNAFLKQAQLRVERYVEQKDGQWVLKELK